jgi:DNA-binding NtrC family response regulator
LVQGRADVPQDDPVPLVCLAGHDVSTDWPLIQLLMVSHAVILLERVENLGSAPLLAAVRVLVMDAAAPDEVALRLVPEIHGRYPALAILLVDGGVNQCQLVRAFREGTCDYFPVPYNVQLLAERVGILCMRPPGVVRRGRGQP